PQGGGELEALRRRIAERNQLVSRMTQLKNRGHSVLQAAASMPSYLGPAIRSHREWIRHDFRCTHGINNPKSNYPPMLKLEAPGTLATSANERCTSIPVTLICR